MHHKIKVYKDQSHEIPKLQEDLRKYKKKYESLHHEHDQKTLELQEIKLKVEYHEKNASIKLKEGYETKIRDLQT